MEGGAEAPGVGEALVEQELDVMLSEVVTLVLIVGARAVGSGILAAGIVAAAILGHLLFGGIVPGHVSLLLAAEGDEAQHGTVGAVCQLTLVCPEL